MKLADDTLAKIYIEPQPARQVATDPVMEDDPDILMKPDAAQIDVSLEDHEFVDVIWTPGAPGDDRLSTATWRLKPGGPSTVTQRVPNGTITVKDQVVLAFELGPGSKYHFTGIAFRMVRGAGDINGNRNLPKEHIRVKQRADGSSTIYVRNLFKDKGPANTVNWDFFLFVQNESGVIGIIDPDIENEI